MYVTGTDRDNFSLSTIWDTSGSCISVHHGDRDREIRGDIKPNN